MNIPKIKISNFNSLIIFFVILVFGLLFFYSFPNIHNKYEIQKHFSDKIYDEYPLNLSLSPDITYSILPKPHFRIKNIKIFFKTEKNNNVELGEAKLVKVFFSNIGSIDVKKLILKKIIIQDCDLRLDQENFKYFKNILDFKINKELEFNKTRLFVKKNKNFESILNLILIDQISVKYDLENNTNYLKSVGKLFNQKTNFQWNKNLKDKKNKFILKIKPLNFNMETIINNTIKNGSSTKLKLDKSDLVSQIYFNEKEKLINFKSIKSKLVNSNIDYKLNFFFDPFYFDFKIDLEKIDLAKFLKKPVILEQILKKFIIGNEVLNGSVKLNILKFNGSKIFNNSNINLDINNKIVSLTNSLFNIKNDIGNLKILSSNLILVNNELILNGQFKVDIKDQSNFYRLFLVPKNKRKKLKTINFYLEYNLTNKEVFISDPRLNDSEKIFYKLKSSNLVKWISLKKYVNQVFSSYDG